MAATTTRSKTLSPLTLIFWCSVEHFGKLIRWSINCKPRVIHVVDTYTEWDMACDLFSYRYNLFFPVLGVSHSSFFWAFLEKIQFVEYQRKISFKLGHRYEWNSRLKLSKLFQTMHSIYVQDIHKKKTRERNLVTLKKNRAKRNNCKYMSE